MQYLQGYETSHKDTVFRKVAEKVTEMTKVILSPLKQGTFFS